MGQCPDAKGPTLKLMFLSIRWAYFLWDLEFLKPNIHNCLDSMYPFKDHDTTFLGMVGIHHTLTLTTTFGNHHLIEVL